MIKSFAQLKRDLQVGVKVKTLVNEYHPDKVGEVRKVMKVQTNAIAFERTDGKPSWWWWDTKHYSHTYEDDTFTIRVKNTNELCLQYQILA